MDKLRKRHNRVFELYEEGIIDKVTLAERLKTIEEEIKAYALRKEEVNRGLSAKNVDEILFKFVKKVMTDFNSVLESTGNEEKKTLLQMMRTRIFVLQILGL